MKLVHKNSLFSVLIRSPWWASLLVAAAIFGAAQLIIPAAQAAFVPLPFVFIALYAAWRQLRSPSAARVAARLRALRALPSDQFSAALESAFRKQGYEVSRTSGGSADLELARAGSVTLLAFRRWKATRTGAEPLRALHAAAQARGTGESIFVTAGALTDNARAYAGAHRVRLIEEAELARLLA